METISNKKIKDVVYQFNRPISAMEIYGSIEEFNIWYWKVEKLTSNDVIKSLEKEYMREAKKQNDYKQEKARYQNLMHGFVAMRITGLLDKEVNSNTKYIDIKYDLYNRNIYAVGKENPYTMSAKIVYYENNVLKNLKRYLQMKLGRNMREMQK